MSNISNARRRAQMQRARSRRKGGAGGNENAALIRLAFCGVIFVLLVAAKLLFPEAVGRLALSARQIIGRDADFQEAFAAMGRAVSGEQAVSDSLQDAYTAVFNPSPQLEEETEEEPEDLDGEPAPGAQAEDGEAAGNAGLPASGAKLLRYPALELPEPDKAVMRELLISPEKGSADRPAGDGDAALPQADAPEDDTAVVEASWLYTMAAMPENASLEQRNLGFSHCTPVSGHLTSTFGWREHPVEGGNKFHYGVDLAAETGTDVLAFADGEVYASGESSTLGNYIMLQHQGGYMTLYAHCSRITAAGGSVKMGDKIAEVGDTGLVTGPHLHFELHEGELYLNPIYYVAVG